MGKRERALTKTQDMTTGREWEHILRFALPLMGGYALQQLYNTVDGIIVGNFVSDRALAAVGTCAPLTMVFIALALGMSNGSAIVVAQYFGARKEKELRQAVSTAIIMLIGLGAVLSVVGVLTARPLLAGMLNVGENYIGYAVDYFSIYAAGLVFQFTYNVCAAILRALGDSKATLYFLLVSSVTNVVLDLLFVIAFQWAVAGAAIATIISQGLSAVVALGYMFRKHEILRFARGEFRFHPAAAALALRLAVPTTLQQCVVSCGNLAVQRLINSFDGVYVGLMAGATAGMRLESFILIPIFAFNVAVATFTGQNIGAEKPHRVRQGRRMSTLMGVGICLVVASVAFLLRRQLVGLFGVPDSALGYGVEYLAYLCPSLLLFCLHMTTSGVMQGAGDVAFNAFITISSLIFRCTAAYVLAYNTPLGYHAIWLSMPMGWLYSGILSWTRFYTGGWKGKAVVGKG